MVVGTNDLATGGQSYQVERLIKHEDYVKETHLNDIAVLRVTGKFEFNDRVGKIELSTEEAPHNAKVKFVGFGVNSVREAMRSY